MRKQIVLFTMLAASSLTQTLQFPKFLCTAAIIPATALTVQFTLKSQQTAINTLGLPSHTSFITDKIIIGSILASSINVAKLVCYAQFKSAKISAAFTAALIGGDLIRRYAYKRNRAIKTTSQQTNDKKK